MLTFRELKRLLAFLFIGPIFIVITLKAFQLPGEMAGALFVSIGIILLVHLIKKTSFRSSPIFWVASAYLFVSTFLFGGNLSHFGTSLSSYTFLNIPAAWIHHITEVLYLAVIILTLVEIYRMKRVSSKAR